jgi:peptidoglycan/LPS O-acetylase OafA/YrhL
MQKCSRPLSNTYQAETINMNLPIHRRRELDFLRGIAILLVLCRHQYLFQFTKYMGWIGVDLFFVLSGFLVSGLLFKEYIRFGNVQPVRFLIRRGFKIYPIYYVFSLLFVLVKIPSERLDIPSVVADIFFVQNYFSGGGYAFSPSWSLAVEEHFYFLLAFCLWISLKKKALKLVVEETQKGWSQPEKIIFGAMLFCLLLRIASNIIFTGQWSRNFAMTHLRLDSLLAGVLVAYLYYFRLSYLRAYYTKYKKGLWLIAFLFLSYTPFIEPVISFPAKTIGFMLVYIAFGIVLTSFLLTNNINQRLNSVFTATFVNIISEIGVCSYAIYTIHTMVNSCIDLFHSRNQYFNFFSSSIISILLGMLITYSFERYFLRLRDKYYPARVG